MSTDYIFYDLEIISCIGNHPGYQCVADKCCPGCGLPMSTMQFATYNHDSDVIVYIDPVKEAQQ